MIKNLLKIIVISIFCLANNLIFGQVTIYQQNFENAGSIPSGWTNEFVSASVSWTFATGGQSSNPATAHGGTYNAKFYSGNYSGDKTKLVTSAINLSGYNSCQLNFWHAQVNWVGDLDTLRVYYKTSVGGAWTLLATYGAEAATWSLRTINLPVTSSTFYIGFEGHSGYGYGVCIDDVSVTGVLPVGADTILVNSANNGLTFNTCNAYIYDNGGPSGDYTNSNNYTITIASDNGGCVRAILQSYNIEYNYDFLYFYDGPNTTYPQIATRVHGYPFMPNTTINKEGSTYYAQSGYLTIKFTSDGATIASGFKIKIDCPQNCIAPSCVNSIPASGNCETATPMCDFNGYCGGTSTAYPADHEELESTTINPSGLNIFCAGIEHNSWLSFVADSTTSVLDVWVKNCTNSYGVQLMVFETDCSFGNFIPKSNCWTPYEVVSGQIVANNLTAGDSYLIMVDGFAGDFCEYTFSASAGVNVASAGTDKTICEGEYASITASGGTSVSWTASPSDPSLSGQESNMSITVSPGQTTTYTAEVWGSNALCSEPADVVVFVNSAEAEFTGLDNAYCSNASAVSLSGNFASGVFSGTGVSGTTFNPASALIGNNNVIYTYNYSVVTVFSDDFDPSPLAGWVHGGTTTVTDSWAWGKPKGGNGTNTNTNSNPDPLIDHSSGNDNNVYGQGLSASTGNGLGGYYNSSSEWLKTPFFNCTNISNTTLSFWRWANFEPNYDPAYVKVSNDNVNWTTVNTGDFYPQDDHWVQKIYDISQWADGYSTVYVRWSDANDGSQTYSGWNIDDVTITGVQSGGSCVSTDLQTTYINPVLSATISAGTAISCYGGSNGTATVTPSGGTAPYTYLWTNGQTTATATGLSAGTHYVTINDSYGVCASVIKNITISQPSQITITPSSTPSTCGNPNGSASVSVSGGTGALSILWSTGATTATISNIPSGSYSVTVTDANGCTKTTLVGFSDTGAPSANINSSTNVNCYGASTGSATVTVSGGSGSYTYAWSGSSSTTATASNLTAGTYTVTVTDGSCTAPASVTISQPAAPLSVTVSSQTNVLCFGNSTGSATVSVTGGTTSYSYSWQGGGTTASKTNLSAGIYTVTVTDSKSCQATQTVTITQPASALSVSISTGNIACNGGTTTATATVTGGTSGYLYLWSSNTGFQTTSTASNLSVGTYSVSIQDANSCTATSSVTIIQPTAISVSSTVTITDVVCYGQSNGAINIAPTGGNQPYTYVWVGPNSYSATTEDISGTVAGSYNLTVTDANGCKSYNGFTVSQPNQLDVVLTGSSVSCSGGSTDINSSVSGGTSPYTYLWAGGQTSASLTNVSSGTYTLTATDANNCKSNSSITITQPAPLTVTLSGNNVSCNGGKTDITTSVTGGSTPYTYIWNNGQTTSSLNNVTAGTYSVTIQDSFNCSEISSITITQPSLATISYTSNNVNCFGESNGSINISVSGGTPSYTFSWSNGSSIQNQTNLIAGTYSISVTDNNSCIYDTIIIITQPSQLTANVTGNNVTCNGGTTSASVSVSGGTNPYTYNWSNNQYSNTISNISAGTYTVTVTDNHNCVVSKTITITEPSAIVLTPSVTNSSCGNSDGSASVSVTGGAGSYSYSWSTGGTLNSITGLLSGTYGVTVTDNASCTATSTLIVNDDGAPSVTIGSIVHVNCFNNSNGSAIATATGGTTPYIYSWSNGNSTNSISGVAGNEYSITITDANNCKANATVTINEPANLLASANTYNSTCYNSDNGWIDLTVTGGTQPYSYSWTNSATTEDITALSPNAYTVTIIDDNGCQTTATAITSEPNQIAINSSISNITCNGLSDGTINLTVTGGSSPYTYFWSNGGASASLSNLSAGTYAVTINDFNNCQNNTSITITQPDLLSYTSISSNVSCFSGSDGSINLSVSGGTTPYSYSWSPAISNSSSATGLYEGTYLFTVTDNNNCSNTGTKTITQPQILTSSITPTNITCNSLSNGSINITVTGGTTPYSYYWSNGATTQNISSLSVGSYSVTVTDNKLCTSVVSSNITQPNALTNSNTSQNVSCFGKSDGSIDLSVNGGTTPYTYIWSNGQTTQDISSISANTYSVTIYDANNCISNLSVSVTQPNSISYSVAKTNITCYGYSNGAIDLTINGGTSPFSYIWTGGETTQDISDIASGSYAVTVTDANNCDLTASVSISEPAQIVTSIVGNDVTCNGLSNGNINLTVSGGLMPYYYSWNYGQVSQDLFNIDGGTYEVTITDSYNCSKIESYTIYEPGAIVLSSTSTNVNCYQGNDGTANINVTGGLPAYTFTWSNGYAGANATKLTSGTYTITVTDSNGCEEITSLTITEPTLLATFIATSNVSCYGFNNGSAAVNTVGGTTPYSFIWNNGNNQSEIFSLSPGDYTVTVSDANNCSKKDSITISQPNAQLLVEINDYSTVICYGASNGHAMAVVSGGTQPYTYNWDDAANQKDSLANNLLPGTYNVTVTDTNSCLDTIASVTISEAGEIKYNYISTQTSCNGSKDGSISVSVSGVEKPYKFTWNTNPVKTDSIITNLAYGTYILTISDKYNCLAIDTITVLKPDNTCLEIPTCFTPNGDGVNDKFEIKYSELYPDIHVEIYNRWGIMMFKSDGYLEMWDGTYNGKEATLSSYVYIITLGDGSDPITGSVSIVK